MQIKFIGHSFHQQTQSSKFFLDILRKIGDVHINWDQSWEPGLPGADLSDVADYDLVVVYQMEFTAMRAAELKLENTLFVPMYDGAKYLNEAQWQSLNSFKVLNFCSYLHEYIQRLGLKNSAYFQYFPNPELFKQVTDFTNMRAFFWQRRKELSWKQISILSANVQFDSFVLHSTLDPKEGSIFLPDEHERKLHNFRITSWFEDKSQFYENLQSSNLFFAPRLDEGIGMSFLEALAMGIPVVGNSAPTINEYIVDGVNGYLYNEKELKPLNFPSLEQLSVVGSRARESVIYGYERWVADEDRMLEFITTPQHKLDAKKFYFSKPPAPKWADSGLAKPIDLLQHGGKREESEQENNLVKPIITIAVVVKNARDDLALTLSSILEQDFANREVVVIDGGSRDGTLELLSSINKEIDFWESKMDKGPYHAMNRAVEIARGEWIIFMNAGDYFSSNQSLRHLYGCPTPDVDFIIGHHVYLSPNGIEEVHRVRDFNHTWSELVSGNFKHNWLSGVPGHQATLTRVELLKDNPFNTKYKIAADHELMYRMRFSGKKFYVNPVIASLYRGGGMSWKNMKTCIEEWVEICSSYSSQPEAVKNFFFPMLITPQIKTSSSSRLVHIVKITIKHPRYAIAKIASYGFSYVKRKLARNHT